MREKLAIAKKLRNSRKNFSNKEHLKMCSKCYRTYIVECIIKGNDNFQIVFKGKYIRKLSQILSDWLYYVIDNIFGFDLVRIKTNNITTYKIVHTSVAKPPVNVRVSPSINEYLLETFLNENGLKIVDEHLYSTSTVYDITRI